MANYREPQWLLPNEKNLAMPASDATVGSGLAEDRHSLYSMHFDGTNDYINLGTPSTFAFGTGDFSISGWVYLDTSSGYQWIFSTGTNFAFGFDSSRNLQLWVGGTATTPTFNINLNQWHHVVATRNSGTVTFYIDGVAHGTTYTRTGSISAGTYNYIGTFNIGQNHIDGKIDELAIWNRALSAGEVSALATANAPANILALSDKPVAYYPLGEQARRGSEWQFPNEVLQSQVFDFDATDYINISPILPLQGLSSFSLSTWVYWDGHGGGSDQWIFMHANAGNTKRIQLEVFGSDLYFQIVGTGGGYAQVDMPQGKWVNLLCVFNSSEAAADRMIVYIDGERATNVAYSAPTMTTTETDYTYSMIGARNNGNYFDGKMSNVAIWNSDQTANKDNIYNNGSPQSYIQQRFPTKFIYYNSYSLV